jgi:hypothetical protein
MKYAIFWGSSATMEAGTKPQLIRQSINLALEYLIHKSFQ